MFGLSLFANGVPQTPDNVVSLAYLQIPASAPYETADTVATSDFGADRQIKKRRSFPSGLPGGASIPSFIRISGPIALGATRLNV